MKANHKRLKVVLVSGVRNFGLAPVASKLIKFLFFDNFFPDLAKFWDLDVFSLFDFPDLDNFLDLDNFPAFLACYRLFLLILNLLTSPLLLFLPKASLLLLFLLEADLLPLFLLKVGLSDNLIVFSIKVSRAAILLKPWINYQ